MDKMVLLIPKFMYSRSDVLLPLMIQEIFYHGLESQPLQIDRLISASGSQEINPSCPYSANSQKQQLLIELLLCTGIIVVCLFKLVYHLKSATYGCIFFVIDSLSQQFVVYFICKRGLLFQYFSSYHVVVMLM